MKKKDALYISILMIFPLLLIYVLLGQDHTFGHTVDWLNQHVMISDALRYAMIQQKTPFPTYVPSLMAGMNIFHFSYYGYLRLDVLIGALFSNVKMIDIIIFYQIFLIVLTGVSAYFFLKRHFHQDISFFVSLLVLLSSLFFQSHKQIMFVNYLPFLFLAFICLDDDLKPLRLLCFILCGVLIVIHSYFYSFACFFICFVYYVYRLYIQNKFCFKYIIIFLMGAFHIVLLTAILTIPTLFVIFNNSKSVQFDYRSLCQVTFSLKGLLYDSYGCGMTYIAWIALVLGLNDKKIKYLSLLIIVSMIFPVMSYFLNGFLYARSKILIVFIPLVAYILAYVMNKLYHKKMHFTYWQVPLFVLPLFFIKEPLWGAIDLLVCLMIFILTSHSLSICCLYLCIPLVLVYQNNVFLDQNVVKTCFHQETTTLLQRHQDSIVRLGQLDNHHLLVNNTYQTLVSRASGYTSTNHTLYNSFLYDTLKVPISTNNRVSNEDSAHIFYLHMMSINSLMGSQIPAGYTLKDQYQKQKFYQSNYTMPMAYASSDLYSKKQWKKLAFPYNLDVLYNHVIVQKGKSHTQSQVVCEKIPVSSYHVQNKKRKTITRSIKRTTDHEILIIEFDVKNFIPKQSVSITINGMKNQLSNNNHPYYNGNTHFTYVLSNDQTIEQLKITLSKGNYQIDNIQFHSLDFDVIKNRSQQVDTLHLKKGDGIINGTINVSKKGYFVTNIPYEKGYSIYIDHKKVKPEIVNTAFLGCPIDSGKHEIVITYQPPGYLISLKLSALGLCLTFLQIFYERKKVYEKI